jgi:hypothetical protein
MMDRERTLKMLKVETDLGNGLQIDQKTSVEQTKDGKQNSFLQSEQIQTPIKILASHEITFASPQV